MAENQKAIIGTHLLLVRDNSVLLMKKKGGQLDGLHTFISGHVEKGESVIDALIREAKEEADIDLKHEDLKISVVVQRTNAPYKGDIADIIDFFILCENYSGEIKNNEPEKCDEIKFYKFDSLPDTIAKFVGVALKAYFSGESFIIQKY